MSTIASASRAHSAAGPSADLRGENSLLLRVAIVHNGLVPIEPVCDALKAAAGIDAALKVYATAWTFNSLARLDVRHASMLIAAEADVLIVAGISNAAFPAHFTSWMAECLRESVNQGPLILGICDKALDHPERDLPAKRDLCSLAEKWCKPCHFCSSFDESFTRRLRALVAGKFQPAARRNPDFALPELSAPSTHWGINE